MDAPLVPPIRLQPGKSTPISNKTAEAHIKQFLIDYTNRMLMSGGAVRSDTTITAQLQSLSAAMHDERKKKKATRGAE